MQKSVEYATWRQIFNKLRVSISLRFSPSLLLKLRRSGQLLAVNLIGTYFRTKAETKVPDNFGQSE